MKKLLLGAALALALLAPSMSEAVIDVQTREQLATLSAQELTVSMLYVEGNADCEANKKILAQVEAKYASKGVRFVLLNATKLSLPGDHAPLLLITAENRVYGKAIGPLGDDKDLTAALDAILAKISGKSKSKI